MTSRCLVAEGVDTTKTDLDEIAKIMAGVSLQGDKERADSPSSPVPPVQPAKSSPPPAEAPATVLPETTQKEDGGSLDKTLLGEADPYFKTSSDDDETATYI